MTWTQATSIAAESERVSNILSAAQSGDVDLFWASAIADGELHEIKEQERGRTALHFAAQAGHLQLCKHLLENLKFNVNAQDKHGDTALSLAAAAGQDEIIDLLLHYGADPRLYKAGSAGPLHRAAGAGSAIIVRRLVRAGADVNANSESGPPLFWAAGSGHAEAVLALLRAGADPNLLSSQHGMTPLAMAAAVGCLDVVKVLLAGGAKVDAVVQGGFTALHIAAESGNEEMVQLLLKAGATPDIRDDHGKTPIRVAAEMGHKEVVAQLAHSALGTAGMVPLDNVNEEYGDEEEDEEFDEDSELSDGEDYSDGGEGGSTAGSSSGKSSEEGGPSRMDQQGAAVGSGQQAQQGSDEDAPARAGELQRISLTPVGEGDEGVAEMFRQKATEFFMAGDYQGAVQLYTLAIQHCNRSPLLWGNRAAAYLKKGDFELALSDARAARTIDSSYAKGWYREGLAAQQLGRWDEAVAAYTELRRIHSDCAEVAKLLQDAQQHAQQAQHATQAAAGAAS
ncbi:hypothetical protein N2152v2_008444 [Parachlorella kessleri]